VPAQDPEQGVYAISVAADIVGTNIANLRVYERRGLLEPARTEGGTRLYSQADLERLTRIVELLEAGVNLAGIAMVLDLEEDIAELRRRRRT
jgi:MerR family transcriptional regulator, heat shock protein HspR